MLLTEDAGVASYVGDKVFWVLAPKGKPLPYVVIQRVATDTVYDLQGPSGLRSALYQFDCYATTYLDSRAMSLAVRNLCEGFRGNLPDADATPVSGMRCEKDFDLSYEEGAKGFVFRALLQFRIWHYDTVLPVSTPSNPEAVLDGGTGTYDDTGDVTEAMLDGGTN
jgi:Protein of unknown function (DUF3168)